MPMLEMNMKDCFFDRQAVKDAVGKANIDALGKAGATTRKIAMNSMRTVAPGAKPSAPGQPPHALRSHPWIKKNLWYAWDDQTQSVVVGPVGFPRSTMAQRNLEFGVSGLGVPNRRRRIRQVGHGGEIQIGGRVYPSTRPVIDQHGQSVAVTYIRLRTQAQADRANRLNEQLFGPPTLTLNIEARPFMGPAMQKAVPSISRLWKDSIRS